MLATPGFDYTAAAASVTIVATAGLVLLLVLALRNNRFNPKGQDAEPDRSRKRRTAPPASWHQTSHRSRKQKHKIYIAPVIKRKWRTPRRSSH